MTEDFYRELFCETCRENTSHVQVDTVEGQKYSCEICGSYYEGIETLKACVVGKGTKDIREAVYSKCPEPSLFFSCVSELERCTSQEEAKKILEKYNKQCESKKCQYLKKCHIVKCDECDTSFIIPDNPTLEQTREYSMHKRTHQKGYGAEFGQDTHGT